MLSATNNPHIIIKENRLRYAKTLTALLLKFYWTYGHADMVTSKKWGFAAIPVDSSVSLVWKTELNYCHNFFEGK